MDSEPCQHGVITFCHRCWVNKNGQVEPFERWVKRVCSKPRAATKDEAEIFFAQASGWMKTTPGIARFKGAEYDVKCAIAEYIANQSKLTLFPCLHRSRKSSDEGNGHNVKCDGCGKALGWYCSSSPDHLCHYHTTRDRDHVFCVELVDKKLSHDFPREEWAPEHESYDRCLYCKLPENRDKAE